MEELFESVVCPGCGCLCDDIDIRVEGGRVLEVGNCCTWGAGRFFLGQRLHPKRPRHRAQAPFIRKDSRPVDVGLKEALEEASAILRRAGRVLFYGLGALDLGAQENAIRLAKGLNADIEVPDTLLHLLYFDALKENRGLITGLDEIRDRAEAVIFWGANPIHSAPRLAARYAVFARGRFMATGVEERRAFSVDAGRTETGEFTEALVVTPEEELEAARGLAAAARGDKGARSNLSPGFKGLYDASESASFGALFLGRGATYGPEPGVLVSSLVSFASHAGLAVMPISPDFNTTGAVSLLLSEGYDMESFTPSKERSFLLHPEGYDAVLVAGADPVFFMSDDVKKRLTEAGTEVIAIQTFTNYTTKFARVALPCGLLGLEKEGLALRMDGALMKFISLTESAYPGAGEILARIEEKVCG